MYNSTVAYIYIEYTGLWTCYICFVFVFSVEMAKTNSTEIFAITFGSLAGGMALIMIIVIFIIVLLCFKRGKSCSCAAVEVDNTTRYVMNL